MNRKAPRRAGHLARSRGFRPDITVVVAVVLVVVVAVAVIVTRPRAWSTPSAAPVSQPLSSAVRVCPAPLQGSSVLYAASTVAGTATVGGVSGAQSTGTSVSLAAGDPVPLGASWEVVNATGPAATGLAVSRWTSGSLAAIDCPGPATDEWFTGLGAGPVHDSVIQIANPTAGEAVVDLLIYGASGQVDVPQLRGIAVPAYTSSSFDLLRIMPSDGVFAVHAQVDRGQAVVTAVDRALKLTGARGSDEWLAPQVHPSRDDVVLGVEPGAGSNTTLTVANPSAGQLSATLRLVTPDSVFTPDGVPDLSLPPHSVTQISLDKVLAAKLASGTIGVEVEADGPVTASVRRTTTSDLVVASAGDRVGQPTTVLVPPGVKQLLLLGDTGSGTVTVTAAGADGGQLASQSVALTADQGARVALPSGAIEITVTPDNLSLVGSVLISAKGGTTVVPLRERVRRNLVPAVNPGLG